MSIQIDVTKLIVKRLHELLSVPVVPADNAGLKPPYPFLSYKATVARAKTSGQPIKLSQPVASLDPDFDFDIKERLIEQGAFTLSFSAYDDNAFGAQNLADQALTAIQHTLYYELKDINAVVASVEAIGDRSILIVDSYEYRFGFDAIIRVTSETARVIETMENIKIGGNEN